MNIKSFLKLTCAVIGVSVISTGDVSSSIFAGLANQAKSAFGNAKNQLATSVSGLSNQAKATVGNAKSQVTTSVSGLTSKAKQTIDSTKTKTSAAIKNAQDQANASLTAVKKAGADAIATIDPNLAKSEETSENVDEKLLDDDLLSLGEDDSTGTLPNSNTPELNEKESKSEDLSQDNSSELLLDDISPSETSDTITSASNDLLIDDAQDSDFSEEVIMKVDSLFPEAGEIASAKILDLSNKNLNDQDIAYIATVKMPTLLDQKIEKITLKLSNNNFTHEGLKVLLDSLKTTPKLVSILDCSGNNIGDEGAMAVADSCQQLPLNHTIILSNCGISGTGILGFLSSILDINNSTYQYLDLSKNNIDPSYTPLIIEKLQKVKENSFEDGINISEAGLILPEGASLPENIIINK